MRRAPAAALFACAMTAAANATAQQRGSIQISTESQVVGGDSTRTAGEQPFQPDLGILWQQPGVRFGQFVLETRATRRGDGIHLGRTWLALRDGKKGGFTWSFEGGDLYTSPAPGDYQFSNLSTPAFTFMGGAMTARSPRSTIQVVGGRTTALRNIFGTDPQALGQTLGIARAMFQPGRRLQLNARVAHTRTTNLLEFTRTVDASDQGGGGARVTVTPWLQLVADGSYVRYRATGASASTDDYSYLAGAHLLLSRGWVQVNANRFSPGDLPVLNAPLQDRQGAFAAGEYDMFSRARLFGGWERVDTNINPAGVSVLRPSGTVDRGFGGVRVRVGGRSMLSLRLEEGDRLNQPIAGAVARPLAPTTSDTGVLSAEWQTNVGKVSAFGRYSRRSNVDSSSTSASFTQHDGSGQVYLNVARKMQIFGSATLTDLQSIAGTGSTYLQVSAGGQRQIKSPGLWLRVEGTASRNRDVLSGALSPRDALNVGLNGQLTSQTMLGLNVYVDRAPIGLPGSPDGWLTRSTIRLVHNIPTGSVRVASNGANTIGARTARGTGSVLGRIFADWNANGAPDPDEELLAGIPVQLGTISHVTTARDGQFAFLNVPAGAQHVGLDLSALPVDFDPPEVPDVIVEIARGGTKRVTFGLVPLGTIRGRVFEDANKNGQLDPGEPPIEGAVLVLDGGQRSELARKGSFRFDAVRAGNHRVQLLRESLAEGASIVGEGERALAITHDHPVLETTFLVKIDKRPEIRKVFPPKIGSNVPPKKDLPARAGSHAVESKPAAPGATARPRPTASPSRTASPTRTAAAGVTAPQRASRGFRLQAEGLFTVQIAALEDTRQAEKMAGELKSAGFPSYVVAPGALDPDAPYRIRVGKFAKRADAQQMAAKLEKRLGEKMWVTRAR